MPTNLIIALLLCFLGAGYFAAKLVNANRYQKMIDAPGPDFPLPENEYIVIPKHVFEQLNGIEKNAIYDAHLELKRHVPEGKYTVSYKKDHRWAVDPLKLSEAEGEEATEEEQENEEPAK